MCIRDRHDTVAAVKAALDIPVVANGDVDTPAKALAVLRATRCDAVMIGRAAQGRPWIFREIVHFLETGLDLAPPTPAEMKHHLLEHLVDHHALYGHALGVRNARKHIGWYVRGLPGGEAFRQWMNRLTDAQEQAVAVAAYFDALARAQDAPGAPMDRPWDMAGERHRYIPELA